MLANQSVKDILKIDESPEGKQVIEIVRNIDLINLISLSMSTASSTKVIAVLIP